MDTPEQPIAEHKLSPNEFITQLSEIYDIAMPAQGTLSKEDVLSHLSARGHSETAERVDGKVEDILRATPIITEDCRDWIRGHVGFDFLTGKELGMDYFRSTILKNAKPMMENYNYTDEEFFREFERECYNAELRICLHAEQRQAEIEMEDRSTQETPKGSFIGRLADRLKSIIPGSKSPVEEKNPRLRLTESLYAGWRQSFIENYHQTPE